MNREKSSSLELIQGPWHAETVQPIEIDWMNMLPIFQTRA
jgi:hypothetical protein